MCEYCEGTFGRKLIFENEQGFIRLTPYKSFYVYMNEKTNVNFYTNNNINYCPMCGRKLEDIKINNKRK